MRLHLHSGEGGGRQPGGGLRPGAPCARPGGRRGGDGAQRGSRRRGGARDAEGACGAGVAGGQGGWVGKRAFGGSVMVQLLWGGVRDAGLYAAHACSAWLPNPPFVPHHLSRSLRTPPLARSKRWRRARTGSAASWTASLPLPRWQTQSAPRCRPRWRACSAACTVGDRRWAAVTPLGAHPSGCTDWQRGQHAGQRRQRRAAAATCWRP